MNIKTSFLINIEALSLRRSLLCRFVLGVLLLVLFSFTNADLIHKMNNKLFSEKKSFEFAFEFEAQSEDGTLLMYYDGVYFLQGEKYMVSTEQYDIYSDATKKWFLDKENQELYIFNEQESEGDITENPFSLLKDVDALFKYKNKEVSGESSVIILDPLDKDAFYKEVQIEVDNNTFLPRVLSYILENGDRYTAKITNSKETSPLDDDFFSLDPSSLEVLYPDLYVTDMVD